MALYCSRRKFLMGASLVAGAAFLGNPARLLAEAAKPGHFLVAGSKGRVCRINLRAHRVEDVKVGFKSHSFLQHLHEPDRFYSVGKWIKNAAMVNFKTGKASPIEPPADHTFYGHGAFAPAGDKIHISCVDEKTGFGHVAAYDVETLKFQGRQQVSPGRLHQVRFLPDGTLLVASNGLNAPYGDIDLDARLPGTAVEQPALIQVDLSSGKTIHKTFTAGKTEGLAHFNISSTGALIAVSSPLMSMEYEPGIIYFAPKVGDPLQPVVLNAETHERVKGEMLSIAIDEKRQVAAVTSLFGDIVMFIDLRKGTHLGSVFQGARGVSYDPELDAFLFTDINTFFVLREMGWQAKPEPFAMASRRSFDSSHSLIV